MASRILVILEQPYFAAQTATHLVTVDADEAEREYRFFRDARTGQQARSMDGPLDAPGRQFVRDKVLIDTDPVRSGHVKAGIPEIRHASFAAFLNAVGYDWRKNSYRQVALAV